MENSKENKFVCNFCHKSFTCGKSLGGHIRIHKNEKQKERARIVKLQVPTTERRTTTTTTTTTSSKRDSESEVANGNNSSYGLRENPKITQRFANSGFSSRQEKFCRTCNKWFESSETWCWHLTDYYEEKNQRLEYYNYRESIIENRLDNPERVREAAICLMMMSKAPRFSVAESSDSKSSSRQFREETETSASNSNGPGLVEMKEVTGRINKLEVSDSDSENENFRKDIYKKVKLKAVAKRPLMDEEYKKNPDVKFGVRIKNSMKTKQSYDQVLHASSYKYELRKRLKNDLYSPDLWEGCSSKKIISNNGGYTESHHHDQSGENSVNTTTNSIPNVQARELTESSNPKNKSHQDSSEEKKLGPKRKHKCPICSKAFKSGQALGGHKRSHVVGSLEETSIVTRQECLIDLNVPAPMEEEEESGGWD